MRIVALISGALAVALGGLWLLQGLGIVQIDPVMCVGECEPLEGPSPVWAIAGAIVVAVGGAAVFWGIKRRA